MCLSLKELSLHLHWFLIFLGVIAFFPVYALEILYFQTANLQGLGWRAENMQAHLDHIHRKRPSLTLTAERLHIAVLQQPLEDVHIYCPHLLVTAKQFTCPKTQLKIGNLLEKTSKNILFKYLPSRQQLQINFPTLALAQGKVGLEVQISPQGWQVNAALSHTNLENLLTKSQNWFTFNLPFNFKGIVNASISVGSEARGTRLMVKGAIQQFAFANKDFTQAGEKLALTMDTTTLFSEQATDFQGHLALSQGEVFIDPIYLNLANKTRPVSIRTSFSWQKNQFILKRLHYDHQDILRFSTQANFDINKTWQIKSWHFKLPRTTLRPLYSNYLASWVQAKLDRNLNLTGEIQSELTWQQENIIFRAQLFDIGIEDEKRQFGWFGVNGIVQWHNQQAEYPTILHWSHGYFSKLTFGSSKLYIDIKQHLIRLRTAFKQPILDGTLIIEELQVDNLGQADMTAEFTGMLRPISLETLSQSFLGVPLKGQISGMIPSVHYQKGRLTIGGALLIKAFEGEIVVHTLSLEKIFGNLPTLAANVDINRINLQLLTNFTEFGEIQGELSGYIHNLRMLNWRPIEFDAYFSTPENDQLPKKISQKAVANLTNLGKGAVGAISQTALSVFENFSYEKLGWGCRLQNNICFMRGAASKVDGYYIVKGGGLPRIDIIGYNTKVDWQILINRLQNIINIRAPIIE